MTNDAPNLKNSVMYIVIYLWSYSYVIFDYVAKIFNSYNNSYQILKNVLFVLEMQVQYSHTCLLNSDRL